MISTASPHAPMRELCSRAGDGIEVVLLWMPAENELSVAVVDTKLNEAFHIRVETENAMRVFHHPYPHAARLGLLDREPDRTGALIRSTSSWTVER